MRTLVAIALVVLVAGCGSAPAETPTPAVTERTVIEERTVTVTKTVPVERTVTVERTRTVVRTEIVNRTVTKTVEVPQLVDRPPLTGDIAWDVDLQHVDTGTGGGDEYVLHDVELTVENNAAVLLTDITVEVWYYGSDGSVIETADNTYDRAIRPNRTHTFDTWRTEGFDSGQYDRWDTRIVVEYDFEHT